MDGERGEESGSDEQAGEEGSKEALEEDEMDSMDSEVVQGEGVTISERAVHSLCKLS